MQNTNTRSTMFNGLLKLVLRDTNNITPTSAILVVFGEQNEVCPRQSPSRKNKHQRLTCNWQPVGAKNKLLALK